MTSNLFEIAAETLSHHCPVEGKISESILPPITAIRNLSKHLAFAIIQQAIIDGHSPLKNDKNTIQNALDAHFWTPHY